MTATTSARRVGFVCPACTRQVFLTLPDPEVVGSALCYDARPTLTAMNLHLRVGCEGT